MIKKISIILASLFLITLSYQIFKEDNFSLPEDSRLDSYTVIEESSNKKSNVVKEEDQSKKGKEISQKYNKEDPLLEKKEKKIKQGNKMKGFFNQEDKKFDKKKYKFSNTKNEDWEIELKNRLLDSLDDKPELTIKKERSLIKILKDKARYIEQAQIIIDHEDGRQDSFRALIDSESGKIIRSWDRTIHENFIKKPRKFSPSGKL